MWRNTDRCWGAPARLMHWLVAALVLVQCVLGAMAVAWPLSPVKLDLFVWHKSTGMLVLVLVLMRAGWRVVNVTPALPAETPALERHAARATHLLLYAVLVLLPLSGWVAGAAANVPFRVFRVIPLPMPVAPDEALAALANAVHAALVAALAMLLTAHVAGALRHHFVLRDDVLLRMLRGSGGPE